MSEPKFTRGPWVAEWHRKHKQWNVFVDNGTPEPSGEAIASIYLCSNERSREELDGNAHLIAAAPDLFAFVAEFIEAWDDGMGGDSALRTNAAAVIAKALGKRP